MIRYDAANKLEGAAVNVKLERVAEKVERLVEKVERLEEIEYYVKVHSPQL